MGAKTTGGLSGKERQSHEFGRASRRFADHLISEYFDAEEEVDRARQIPVKQCSAYLTRGGDAEPQAVEMQARFDFDATVRMERPGRREVVWPPEPEPPAPRRKLIDETRVFPASDRKPGRSRTKLERAIRFAKPPASTPGGLPFPQEWRPPVGYASSRRRSSVRGFACGCLLGSALAACILASLRLLLS